ncbi:hypothetical protein LP109_14555 (plasmid) [Moraxella bovis]|uniref:Uncharacterized protein n=1 Tax=Moraxella bovis TaxID=476 RepID=A0ABY6MBC5_MORBO|nr:hypothetical protein [Moraxella bovis]UYZ79776.1 hypothetical protein LP115_14200 [Moraxella bovis]UYZ88262.1 hypothetical protein LP094_14235 [Moraxella bovis]UYZ90992.1 hypothetical protein LP114_14295 [Moraxella bovis]UYZ99204.1 hypothetical protein LP107_14115 [Moraxella bovis]UZA01899.1 hypothetical protein LP086_14005 [Moraxella bovis]
MSNKEKYLFLFIIILSLSVVIVGLIFNYEFLDKYDDSSIDLFAEPKSFIEPSEEYMIEQEFLNNIEISKNGNMILVTKKGGSFEIFTNEKGEKIIALKYSK